MATQRCNILRAAKCQVQLGYYSIVGQHQPKGSHAERIPLADRIAAGRGSLPVVRDIVGWRGLHTDLFYQLMDHRVVDLLGRRAGQASCEGPRVRGLAAGGRRIRTIGTA